MSVSLHSSTENLGGGRRSWSSGSNSRRSFRLPVKSSIGLMSRKVSARPLSRKSLKESRWMAMRSGSSRTSSRLANEKRSLDAERDGKGLLLRRAGRERRGGHLGAFPQASSLEKARSGRPRQPTSVRVGPRESKPYSRAAG